MQQLEQGKINHVVFLLDGSGSMHKHARDLIKVVDNQISFLAQLSRDMDQETRVTVYVFDDTVQCVIFDKDVLRLPSIEKLYWVRGQTALIDATVQSQDELAQTFRAYGDHAFLTYIFTDGFENASRKASTHDLRHLLGKQGPEWTVAGLVPDINSRLSLEQCGIPKGNISIWDTASATGVEEAGTEIQASTQSYFTMRAAGGQGTRTLFSTDANAVNAATIKAAGLKPLSKDRYSLVPVVKPKANQGVLNKDKHRVWEISDFTKHATGNFTVGSVYYQLSKKERIQGNKALAVLENATSKVFVGDEVRAMIGLPDGDKSVAPDFNPDYTIFVQSTSVNRHLVVGTKLLIVK